ncbi:MAG: hypothetical protein ACI3ZP_10185 [Candidatus Cryptobacteroides sp.]
MGCLRVIASRFGDTMQVSCSRVGIGLGVLSAERVGCAMQVSCQRDGSGLVVNTERLGQRLSIYCSLVCDIGVSIYLEVTPEILWMVDGEGVFDVKSNTEWEVYNQ